MNMIILQTIVFNNVHLDGLGATKDYCSLVVYSPLGAINNIPNQCGSDKLYENNGRLCYVLPDNNWHVKSPGILENKCLPGTTDHGLFCNYERQYHHSYTYGKGGCCTIFPSQYCNYRCREGYHDDGCCL